MNKATHANVEATQGPTYGGGYRATVYCGKRVVASAHFPVPAEMRTDALVLKGGDVAYANMKKWLAGFGVQ